MTDLHCHILHDIDDGPAELGEALELCRIAWNNNIGQIVATPHFADNGSVDEFLKTRAVRLDELRKALEHYEIKADIFAGAEVYITDELLSAGVLELLTINESRYILAELPHKGPNLQRLNRYIAETISRGLIPIIAHPERYIYLQRDYNVLNALLDAGVLLQVNADSLFRPGNKAIYKLAKEIIRSKAASFIATDAHSVLLRPNNLLVMLSALPEDTDADYVNALVNTNPDKVLRDKDIDISHRRHIPKKHNI